MQLGTLDGSAHSQPVPSDPGCTIGLCGQSFSDRHRQSWPPFIARRRELGLDQYDEVWEGEYHMAPMAHSSHGALDQQLAELLGPVARQQGLAMTGLVNIGAPDNFRVPDRVVHRSLPNGVCVPTAAIVVEIDSFDDETWEKLPFFAACGVDEVLIVSLERRSVTWLMLNEGRYFESGASHLLDRESGRLADLIEWPPSEPTED